MTSNFKLLIIAGVHGQEPQSSYLLENVDLNKAYEIKSITRFNAYGLENNCRGNENGVDLNRNLPAQNWSKEFSHADYNPGTEPASEQETKEFVSLINEFKPDLIVSIHTNHFVTVAHDPQVNFDGEPDSPGYKLAQKLSELIDLELTCDIGYSTPGSLGSYCKDLKIPCITLELDDDLDNEQTLKRYKDSLQTFIDTLDKS